MKSTEMGLGCDKIALPGIRKLATATFAMTPTATATKRMYFVPCELLPAPTTGNDVGIPPRPSYRDKPQECSLVRSEWAERVRVRLYYKSPTMLRSKLCAERKISESI
jgi:hypothetical protein